MKREKEFGAYEGLGPQMELEFEAAALTVRRKKAMDIEEIGTNIIGNDSHR